MQIALLEGESADRIQIQEGGREGRGDSQVGWRHSHREWQEGKGLAGDNWWLDEQASWPQSKASLKDLIY